MRRLSILLLAAVVLFGSAPTTSHAGDEPTSLVDWLKWLGQDASFAARTALYDERYPGEKYAGSLEQNVKLFETLREERAAGRFPPAGGARPLPRPCGGPAATAPRAPPRRRRSAPPVEPSRRRPTPSRRTAPSRRPAWRPRPSRGRCRAAAPREARGHETPSSDTPAVPVRTMDAGPGWQLEVDARDQVVMLDVMHRRRAAPRRRANA